MFTLEQVVKFLGRYWTVKAICRPQVLLSRRGREVWARIDLVQP